MYRYILMWEQRTTDINMGSFLHIIHDQGVSILADAIEYSKINEASYLSADNFQRYRTIMHFFYQQHRKMNDLLYRGDVLEYMQSLDGFAGYSEKNWIRI